MRILCSLEQIMTLNKFLCFTILISNCFCKWNTSDVINVERKYPIGYFYEDKINYCSPYKFQCDSLQCIPEENECDGQTDCQDGTDETYNCERLPCNTRYLFQCEYGGCISKKLVCDKRNDCKDGSDETAEACRSVQHRPLCSTAMFQCNNNWQCIPEEDQCDGKEDCADGSDETKNCQILPCNSRYLFQCNYGACISRKLICDGINHCRDNSDESSYACRSLLIPTKRPNICNIFKFQCESSTQCIPEEDQCDGKEDCLDGSDESDILCKNIPCNQRYLFQCKYGACINRKLLCDGKNDCLDNSDESPTICSNSTTNCGSGKFRCRSGECISDVLLCDGLADCGDKSDETEILCREIHCPRYTFRCSYGACVSLSVRCNGVRDCIDGSDEQFCNDATTSNPVQSKTCLIPSALTNGFYVLDNRPIINQSYAPSLSSLIINCDEGYLNNPPEILYSICRNGIWTPNPSTCLRSCPSLNLTRNSRVKCEFENKLLESCEQAFEGVISLVPCRQTNNGPLTQNCTFICKNGAWNLLTNLLNPLVFVNNTVLNVSLTIYPESRNGYDRRNSQEPL